MSKVIFNSLGLLSCFKTIFHHIIKTINLGLELIIESGGNANCFDYDHRTPLHLAASEGHLEAVRYLILHGASVHSKDRFGSTPLADAVLGKHDDVCTLLRFFHSNSKLIAN